MGERILGSHRHLRHGGLAGWCEACGREARHKALERSIRESGYATTVRRLNILSTFSKNENPTLHRTAREDMAWIEERHEASGR